jgi:hypothetical protein
MTKRGMSGDAWHDGTARTVARIVHLFVAYPELASVEVLRAITGRVVVRPHRPAGELPAGAALVGVYVRTVAVSELIDDLGHELGAP